MRDFFINIFEKLVGLIIILMLIAVIVGGLATMFGAGMGPGGMGGGFLAGLAVLVIGGIYVVFIGGLMYLGLGIYQNTKATAEALQRMADKG